MIDPSVHSVGTAACRCDGDEAAPRHQLRTRCTWATSALSPGLCTHCSSCRVPALPSLLLRASTPANQPLPSLCLFPRGSKAQSSSAPGHTGPACWCRSAWTAGPRATGLWTLPALLTSVSTTCSPQKTLTGLKCIDV